MSLEKPPLHPSSAASVYGITSTKRREFSIAPRQSVANGLLSPAKAATQRVSSTLQFESLSKGTHVWCLDETDAWVRGVVRSVDSKDKILVYVEEQGSEIAYPINNLELSGGDKGEMAAVDDLTKIPVLHEPAILSALQERFESNIIYTTTGPILIAINPFKRLESLYGEDVVMKYYRYPGSTNSNGRNPPHPYALANAAYHSMVDNNGCNQSILVSGESGAGKTETTKIVMNFLSIASQMKVKSKSSDTGSPNNPSSHSVSARVLQANPLLESLGNAKTVRNDNSSRFGKLIRLCFDPKSGRLLGANFATYLLETPRCCEQSSKERNYHIFYELLAAPGDEERKRWGIESYGTDLSTVLSKFRYTGGSGNQDVRRADTIDKEQYKVTRQAMQILGFSAEEQRAIGDIVLAILHLGNITFRSGPKGEDSSAIDYNDCGHHVDYFCKLLGVKDKEEFERSLCSKIMHVHGGGDVTKYFTITEANEGRDALAMSLYERLFGWVVWRVNESIAGEAAEFLIQRAATRRRHSSSGGPSHINNTRSFGSSAALAKGHGSPAPGQAPKKVKPPPVLSHDYETAILDIFGFEVFEKNSFEQLCINYANEQLQVQFNEFVFELEQAEYTAEGIDWTYVEFPDNSQCVEMIEGRPIGLLALLDEVCLMQGASDIDKSLANKFYEHLTKFDSFYVTSKQKVEGGFVVRHFAGDVQYLCKGFSKKNKNQLHDALVQMMRDSDHWLGSTLLPSLDDTTGAALDMELYFKDNGVRGPDTSGGKKKHGTSMTKEEAIHKRRSQLQQVTVGSHFKMQLAQAMTLIRASRPHFVRCVKPNDKNEPKIMNRIRVASQLRYSGVLEVVKVTQAGYSARFEHNQFIERFEILFGGRPGSNEIKKAAGSMQQAIKTICQDKLKLQEFKDYQLGKTKIFLRQTTCANLDSRKVGILEKSVSKIQKAYRRFLIFKRIRDAKKKKEQKLREEQEAKEREERLKREAEERKIREAREAEERRLREEREARELAERLKREEEERIRLEEERRIAEERRRQEEEERRRREEEERIRIEEERRKAEEERRRLEEERRRAEEERRRVEEERRRAEAERKRLEEEERKRLEAERKRLEEERRKAEIERKRLEEEERKRQEAERKRLEAERKKAEIEERKRQEAERKRLEEERKRAILEEKRRAAEAERKRLEEIAEKERKRQEAIKIIHLYLRPWVQQIRERKRAEKLAAKLAIKEEKERQELEALEERMKRPEYQRQKSLMFTFIPLGLVAVGTHNPPPLEIALGAIFIIVGLLTGAYLMMEAYKVMPPLITTKNRRSAKEIAQLRRKTMNHRQSLARQSAVFKEMPRFDEDELEEMEVLKEEDEENEGSYESISTGKSSTKSNADHYDEDVTIDKVWRKPLRVAQTYEF